jgi:hypothetical protein
MKKVNFEVLMEWVWLPNVSWASRKDDVLKLNAVIRQTVHKMEMEVRKELWEVTFQHGNHSKCCMVEGLNGWWNVLTWGHVGLEEGEYVHDQLLNLASLFEVDSVVYISV